MTVSANIRWQLSDRFDELDPQLIVRSPAHRIRHLMSIQLLEQRKAADDLVETVCERQKSLRDAREESGMSTHRPEKTRCIGACGSDGCERTCIICARVAGNVEILEAPGQMLRVDISKLVVRDI